jgi:hypothetical protein
LGFAGLARRSGDLRYLVSVKEALLALDEINKALNSMGNLLFFDLDFPCVRRNKVLESRFQIPVSTHSRMGKGVFGEEERVS